MAFCPYCREMIGSNVNTCPSCGMSWQGEQQAQHQQAQGYQQPPPQQAPPPQQPAYQQPPPAPQHQETRLCVQCGRTISLQYNLCPYCGKQVAKQPAYQPQPQSQYQQPPPAYAPAPAGPQPAHEVEKVGFGKVISAMVGSILAIVCSFILYMYIYSGAWEFAGVQDVSSRYAYAWLIPIFGILVIVLAIVAFAVQNKTIATVGGVFGLMILLFALILPLHVGSDSGDIVDGFFYSESYAGYTTVTVYLGGFIAIIGGISATTACFGLSRKIKNAQMPRFQAYQPQQPPYGPY